MASTVPTFKLNTGASIPAVGLGTWESPTDTVANAVYTALKAGYRHIDGAAIYKNEEGVGEGISKFLKEESEKSNGVKRSDIFITTKLWLTDFKKAEEALDASLKRLNLEYVDLYLMHWPIALDSDGNLDESISFNEAWANMEKLSKTKAKAIGISNFTISNVKKLLATAKITPAVNQIELHTVLPQQKLIDWLLAGKYGFENHDGKVILPEAYSPMARGNLDDPVIKKIAEKHNTGAANVVLSWGVSRHTVVLPKSVTPERIVSNLKQIKLDEEDLAAITKISKDTPIKRYCSLGAKDVFNDNEDSK